jgi:NADH-quinone oxidoreductase subunit M
VLVLSPLIFGTLALGVYPAAIFDITAASVEQLTAAYSAVRGG